jgi:hypothetical protein
MWRTHFCVPRRHSCRHTASGRKHGRSHECERGTQECVRHGTLPCAICCRRKCSVKIRRLATHSPEPLDLADVLADLRAAPASQPFSEGVCDLSARLSRALFTAEGSVA